MLKIFGSYKKSADSIKLHADFLVFSEAFLYYKI